MQNWQYMMTPVPSAPRGVVERVSGAVPNIVGFLVLAHEDAARHDIDGTNTERLHADLIAAGLRCRRCGKPTQRYAEMAKVPRMKRGGAHYCVPGNGPGMCPTPTGDATRTAACWDCGEWMDACKCDGYSTRDANVKLHVSDVTEEWTYEPPIGEEVAETVRALERKLLHVMTVQPHDSVVWLANATGPARIYYDDVPGCTATHVDGRCDFHNGTNKVITFRGYDRPQAYTHVPAEPDDWPTYRCGKRVALGDLYCFKPGGREWNLTAADFDAMKRFRMEYTLIRRATCLDGCDCRIPAHAQGCPNA